MLGLIKCQADMGIDIKEQKIHWGKIRIQNYLHCIAVTAM